MKKIFFALILCFFISCSKEDKTNDENLSLESTQNASLSQSDEVNFKLDLVDGGFVFVKKEDSNLLLDNNDKAILFVFFTTWCVPCVAEIPHLNKLQEKYIDELSVISVLLEDKTKEEIALFVKDNKINYKIANGEKNYLLARILGGVNGIPTMFLYSKSSKLINQYLGVIPEEMLEIDIQKAIL